MPHGLKSIGSLGSMGPMGSGLSPGAPGAPRRMGPYPRAPRRMGLVYPRAPWDPWCPRPEPGPIDSAPGRPWAPWASWARVPAQLNPLRSGTWASRRTGSVWDPCAPGAGLVSMSMDPTPPRSPPAPLGTHGLPGLGLMGPMAHGLGSKSSLGSMGPMMGTGSCAIGPHALRHMALKAHWLGSIAPPGLRGFHRPGLTPEPWTPKPLESGRASMGSIGPMGTGVCLKVPHGIVYMGTGPGPRTGPNRLGS